MKVSGGNVAEILRGPVGWLVVGGVVLVVGYVGFSKIKDWLKSLVPDFTPAIQNTAAPVSTDGGFYKGSDGVPSTPNETDTLTALDFGNLGA